MRYKILPHTADLRLRVYGKDLEDLFCNASLGLTSVLFKDFKKLERFVRGAEKISIEAPDTEILLVNFLNDILTRSVTDKKIYPRVKILRISPTTVEARCAGVLVNHFDKDIKAVSCHGVKIKRDKEGRLETEFVLDV